jgi:hypothetical protein
MSLGAAVATRPLALCLIFIILTLPVAALSTETTGTLLGQVNDPNGGYVSGATISIRNLETNAQRKTQTNARGEFNVSPSSTRSL